MQGFVEPILNLAAKGVPYNLYLSWLAFANLLKLLKNIFFIGYV